MAGVAKASKLERRGLGLFEQAHADLLEASRLQAEEAEAQRVIAREAALASQALNEQAERNLRRADQLAGFLSFPLG